jgi:hypothetical protein
VQSHVGSAVHSDGKSDGVNKSSLGEHPAGLSKCEYVWSTASVQHGMSRAAKQSVQCAQSCRCGTHTILVELALAFAILFRVRQSGYGANKAVASWANE